MPRGELTALLTCLEVGLLPITYVGDCRAVIDGLAKGVTQDMTSSNATMPDLWKKVQWRLRDHGPGVAGQKIKAHRSATRAFDEGGQAGLAAWRGNRAADAKAKELAKATWARMEQTERDPQQRRERLRELVGRAAILSAVAQKQLDSAGAPRKTKKNRRCANKPDRSVCGSHSLTRDQHSGEWSCSRCRLIANTAASRRSLAQQRCRGELAERIPGSHRVRFSSGVLWCQRCGAYTTRLPRALARECPGQPPSAAAGNVLRRLQRGLMPTTADYLLRNAMPRHARGGKGNDNFAMQRALVNEVALDGVDQQHGGRSGRGVKEAREQSAQQRRSVGGRCQASQSDDGPQEGERLGSHAPRDHPPQEPPASLHQPPGDPRRQYDIVSPRGSRPEVHDDAMLNGRRRQHQRQHGADNQRSIERRRNTHGQPAVDEAALWGARDAHRRSRSDGASIRISSRPEVERRRIDERGAFVEHGGGTHAGRPESGHDEKKHDDRATVNADEQGTNEAEGSAAGATEKKWCAPGAEEAWSRRVSIGTTTLPLPCHMCNCATRSVCRGCGCRICISCAKSRENAGLSRIRHLHLHKMLLLPLMSWWARGFNLCRFSHC